MFNRIIFSLIVVWLTPGLLAAHATEVRTLFVANNGIDDSACGTRRTPCRSINQAVEHATSGDRIVVGPGRYGDLDGDGAINGPGEEAIHIGKAVQVESSDGAGVTMLFGHVAITADGAQFGAPRHGFTIIGTLALGQETLGISVQDNVARNPDRPPFANPGNGVLIGGNGHIIIGNVATGCGGFGFVVSGDGHTLAGNVASGNAFEGFRIDGGGAKPHVLTDNVATANHGHGFDIMGSGHEIVGNSALGNRGAGFQVRLVFNPFTFRGNNIFGNGLDGSNCGVLNDATVALDASHNFWGAASGPGADPADLVCGTGTTTPEPHAKRAFHIPASVGR